MTWIRIFRQLFGVKSSSCSISLKIILVFSFVSSLQFLNCSARIQLLSFAFPVLSVDGILILDFCKFWEGVVLARIIFVVSNCVVFFTFMQIFKKYRKYVCDSLPLLDGFSLFIFDFGDEDLLLR